MILKHKKEWDEFLQQLKADATERKHEACIPDKEPLLYPCLVKVAEETAIFEAEGFEDEDDGENFDFLNEDFEESEDTVEDIDFDGFVLYDFIFIYKTEIEQLLKA